MKRIHLFEFEDFAWFPGFLRECMTRYIVAIHKLLGTAPMLAGLLARALPHASKPQIIDLCSGGGGPMPEVYDILRKEQGLQDLRLTMTDLFPNTKAASAINAQGDPNLQYTTTPVDATDVEAERQGLRTMVCSMHHMRPEIAKAILKDARDDRQPICIYEISDNSFPKWIWWIAFPINILTVLFITPMVRPMTVQQIVFTYLIPILPLVIAWDGAVSNARTYTLEDMDQLLQGLEGPGYAWEKGSLKGKGGNKLYLLGLPQNESATQ